MVKKILDNGYAYEKNGSVYLDVNKYNKDYPYGILSGRNLEDTIEGTRQLDKQVEKKSPVDFAIWKKASKDHIMRWTSPWGQGFPGWHMEECKQKNIWQDIRYSWRYDLMFPH